MCTCCQFRNDTPVLRMHRNLRGHNRGHNLASVAQDGRGGLIARRLDGQQQAQKAGYSMDGGNPRPGTSMLLRMLANCCLNIGAWMLSLHMITASSPLSV